MMPPAVFTLLIVVPVLVLGEDTLYERRFVNNFLDSMEKKVAENENGTETMQRTFETAKKTKVCVSVLSILARSLLGKIRLQFFYGPTTDDRQIVTLADTTKLLDNGHWKQELPIAIYTYGWLHTPTTSYTQEVIKAYYENGNFNLLVVDWRYTSHLEYGMAVTMVPRVGQAVAAALQALLDAGAQLGVVVGHSLGAQISGHIARNLKRPPPFLVGLDPAGPLFYPTMYHCQDALSSLDAEYVMVLHTDWNWLGSNALTGHVDFMPNNGHRLQPGCSRLDFDSFGPLCSHTRAVFLWCEALKNSESLIGRRCSSWDQYKNNQCSNNSVLSLATPTNETGIFYLTTNGKPPYGKGMEGA